MSRHDIREHKRIVRTGATPSASAQERARAQESAVVLLERSIQLRHQRLALRHLANAIRVGAALNSGHWQYCQSIAKSFDAETLARIIGRATASTCI